MKSHTPRQILDFIPHESELTNSSWFLYVFMLIILFNSGLMHTWIVCIFFQCNYKSRRMAQNPNHLHALVNSSLISQVVYKTLMLVAFGVGLGRGLIASSDVRPVLRLNSGQHKLNNWFYSLAFKQHRTFFLCREIQFIRPVNSSLLLWRALSCTFINKHFDIYVIGARF